MIDRILLTAALVMAGLHAYAEDGPYISPTDERVRLTLGVMRPSTDTNLRLDSSAGAPGTPFNAEDVLGLDPHSWEPKFQAMVRVEERHRLWFDYFSLDRTGTATLQSPLAFKNVNLAAGDPVNSTLNFRDLSITYGYSFLHQENYEVAVTLGVNVVDLSAQAKVQQPTLFVDQRQDLAGPFPTLGVAGTWVISKRFYLDGRFQYLKVSVDQLDGSLASYEFDALYRWRANVSIGIGYTGVDAKLSSTQTSNTGFLDLNAKGPQLFARVAF